MKKLYAALLVASLGLVASPAVMAASSSAKPITIQFQKGKYSSRPYHGTVNGRNYQDYKFTAKKGQRLYVDLVGGNVDPVIIHPKLSDNVNVGKYSPNLTRGAYVLPFSGTYTLRIVQPKAGAMKGKVQKYNLKISIR